MIMTKIKTFENLQVSRSGMRNAAMRAVDYSQVQINSEAVQNVNEIFRELAITFPAWRTAYPDAQTLSSAKQVWAKGLIENGITDMALIRVGLRVARSQPMPFIPSVGQFVAWCRSESSIPNLPSLDDVMTEFERFCANHHDYSSPEAYPWSSPVMYWIVLDMRRSMYRYNQTAAEVRTSAKNLLRKWEKKLLSGEAVPVPVAQLENKHRPAGVAQQADVDGRYRMLGNSMLSAIRARTSAAKGVLQ